jgi:molybdate transport system substrate-binding protein
LKRRSIVSFVAVAALASSPFAHAQAQENGSQLLVFAASSLTDVLGELSAAFEKKSGVAVKLSFAASSALARQIEGGAAADVFVSADQEWMNYLAARQLTASGSRRDLAGNRLVLIAPADSGIRLEIAPHFALAAELGEGRLATGDPDTVPVGRYARSALIALGAWDGVKARIARAENVRTALMYVARGEAPLGIVYITDALAEPKVRVVGVFPRSTHPPITYPAAATRTARRGTREYLAFLAGAEAAVTWKKFGFEELAN